MGLGKRYAGLYLYIDTANFWLPKPGAWRRIVDPEVSDLALLGWFLSSCGCEALGYSIPNGQKPVAEKVLLFFVLTIRVFGHPKWTCDQYTTCAVSRQQLCRFLPLLFCLSLMSLNVQTQFDRGGRWSVVFTAPGFYPSASSRPSIALMQHWRCWLVNLQARSTYWLIYGWQPDPRSSPTGEPG
jgi:hypothetical protein